MLWLVFWTFGNVVKTPPDFPRTIILVVIALLEAPWVVSGFR
jgi:hypothetical protein